MKISWEWYFWKHSLWKTLLGVLGNLLYLLAGCNRTQTHQQIWVMSIQCCMEQVGETTNKTVRERNQPAISHTTIMLICLSAQGISAFSFNSWVLVEDPFSDAVNWFHLRTVKYIFILESELERKAGEFFLLQVSEPFCKPSCTHKCQCLNYQVNSFHH